MSLLLRTSKHVFRAAIRQVYLSRHFGSIYSSGTLSKIKYLSSNIVRVGSQRSLQTRCPLRNKAETHVSLSSNAQPSRNTLVYLRQDLYKLDYDARHMGRLQQVEVEKMFRAMKDIGSIESCDGLLIIRCCGSLIPEMPAELRTKLVEEIWNTLPKLSCQYDISHYNALLKVYLENEHRFDPVEFMKSMEEQGIQPNRVTYQHLVSRYCLDGEIEGAKNILEFMKTKNLPVNEQIFNDLIFGHAKANNMENAKEILEVMKGAQLLPSSATYSALACGYALIGDIENVLATVQEMEANGSSFQDKDILRIVYTLTVNQHGHIVQQVREYVIPKLQFQPGYNNKCLNTVLELVNKGHHEIAYTLLNTLPRRNSSLQFGLPFIVQLVKQGLAPDVVIDYCLKVCEGEQNEVVLLKAAETTLRLQKTGDALTYFLHIHDQNHKLRPHFFWPVLAQYKGNDESIYNTLKLMIEKNCPANFDTFLHYTFSNISTSDPDTVITKLKDFGYEVSEIVNPLAAHLLTKSDIQCAVDLLQRYSVKCSSGLLASRWLAFAYTKTQDTKSTVQILELCLQNPMNPKQSEDDIYGLFIVDLLSTNECNKSLLETFLGSLKDKEKKISSSSLKAILKKLGENSSPQITLMLCNLASPEPPTAIGSELSTEKISGEQKPTDELYRLLMLHTKNKDLEKIKNLLKEMKGSGFVHRGSTYVSLMQLFCHHKDLENTMHYKNLIDTEFPDFQIDLYKIISLATLLADNGKYDEAEMVLTKYNAKFGRIAKKNMVDDSDVFQLLNSFTMSDDVGHTRKVFEMLEDFGYCTATKISLGPLIKAYILKNDLLGAVDEYLRIVKTYKVTPWKLELFRRLIHLEDPEILQKVFDAAASVHGESSTMLDLSQAFNDCGQTNQAMKVIMESGKHHERAVNSICENYAKRNMVKELESFLQITKDIPGLDRDFMYYQLLRAYVNSKNVEKALDVWLLMQEENVQPSHRTLRFLGSFLQSMDQPVPFAMPQADNEIGAMQRSLSDQSVTFEMPQDDTTVVATEKRLSINGLSDVDASNLIDVTLKRNDLSEAVRLTDELLSAGLCPVDEVVHQLAAKLCVAGDTKNLTYLEARLPQRISRRIPLGAYLTNCLNAAGQTEEFLNSLETEVSKHKDLFPLGSILILLEEKPSCFERVRKVVDLYHEEGISEPRKVLWMYLMNSRRFEEADKIFESTPEMKSHLFFWSIIKHIKKTNDIEISQKLIDVVRKTDIPDREKGVVYSSHINALVSVNRIEEALNMVKESQSIVNLKELNRGALVRLKDHLIMAGKDVPFAVPEYVRSSKDRTNKEKI